MSGHAADEPVMPFLCVQSKGGPFEDKAFVAGVQLGILYQATMPPLAMLHVISVVYSEIVSTLDLVAMKHGYRLQTLQSEEYPEWTHVDLIRVSGAAV